ncbi:hypothetical protein DRE_05367 [Drechslerella stenobrocha 248]|uniref:rRNA adenine N(6)-methyltransferase n=1 Tax=Drechslerella stenobrocha 248 TaxID=1043628 RepID=W7HQT9_9PEZI|nr:hypothetical protein DRE_05367 [Drechslerella stenobrocha 248]
MLQIQTTRQLGRFTNVGRRAPLLRYPDARRHLPRFQMRTASALRRIIADSATPRRPTLRPLFSVCTPRQLTTTAQPQVLKQRGRPRKPDTEAPVEPTRGRGRPRKLDTAEVEVSRGRGRPRKLDATEAEVEAPRGRGRPRKVNTAAEVEEPTKSQLSDTLQTEVPRGRGRSRKLDTVLAVEAPEELRKTDNAPEVEATEEPRKPDTTPEVETLKELSKSDTTPEVEAPKEQVNPQKPDTAAEAEGPRRIGRPRKVETDEPVEPPKKRGRPKKSDAAAEDNLPTTEGPKEKEKKAPKSQWIRPPPQFGPELPPGEEYAKIAAYLGVDVANFRLGEKIVRGRPRVAGPALPTQTVVVNGITKVIKFRPGRPTGFRHENNYLPDDAPRRNSTLPVNSTIYRKSNGRPPAAPGPLTLIALKYVQSADPNDETVVRALKQNGWYKRTVEGEEPEDELERAADEEDKAQRRKEREEGDRKEKEKEATTTSGHQWNNGKVDEVAEKWRLIHGKNIKAQSPFVAQLLKDIPQPKNCSKSLVISEAKSEEIFKTFDFSEYEGCQILDFNPGFGIYSQALNKAVKPSKHLLFEPETAFHPFLERVCTDSSFRITEEDLYNWKTFDDLVSQGTIAPKVMSREEGVNTSILITGMLHKDIRGDRFMAQIIDAMAKQDWAFRYGRVKLLLWVDHDMMPRYVPRSFGRRNRPAVLAEAFTNIRELALPPQKYTWADLRFLNRMDRWREPGHIPNRQDQITGVAYADLLTYVTMVREPPPVELLSSDYWPDRPWAETTLLEFTPKLPPGDYLQGKVPDTEPWKYFNFIVTTALMSRHDTVREVLTKMGSATEKMLEMDEELAKVPSLAEKHAVHLSVEDLSKLAKAYEFWPWRVEDHFIGSELRLRSYGMLDDEENRW